MRWLTVLYDPACALCCKAASWLAAQPVYVPLRFCAAGSPAAYAAFPDLDHAATRNQLTVVGDGGQVYYDERGWLMCLWALKKYRPMALRFAQPGMLPAAKRFVLWVSRHRQVLGKAPWPGAEPSWGPERATPRGGDSGSWAAVDAAPAPGPARPATRAAGG